MIVGMKYILGKVSELVSGLENVRGIRFYPSDAKNVIMELPGHTNDMLIVDFKDDGDIEIPSKIYRFSIVRQQFELYVYSTDYFSGGFENE